MVLPRRVDAGWAWVVLVTTFLTVMLTAFIYTSGVYNIAFLEIFHMSKASTAIIAATPGAGLCFSGPLSTLLYHHIGARWTIMFGGVLAATGYFLCFFATDFIQVFFTFGVLVGSGLGIMYLPTYIVVGLYFNKYRNISFALCCAAPGVGVILLSPLTQHLLTEYGLRGSMLVLAAIQLHSVPAACVFTPPDITKVDEIMAEEEAVPHRSNGVQHMEDSAVVDDERTHGDNKQLNHIVVGNGGVVDSCESMANGHVDRRAKSNGTMAPRICATLHKSSLNNLSSSLQAVVSEVDDNEKKSELVTMSTRHRHLSQSNPHMGGKLPPDDVLGGRGGDHLILKSASHMHVSIPSGRLNTEEAKALSVGLLAHRVHLSSQNIGLSTNSIPDAFGKLEMLKQLKQSVSGDINQVNDEEKGCCLSDGACQMAVYLAKDWTYWTFNISLCAIYASVSTVFLHFPAYAITQGSTLLQASTLMSFYGAANIVCVLSTGLISTHRRVNSMVLYSTACCLAGGVLLLGPLMCTTYPGQGASAFLIGLFGNSYNALMAPITIELYGLERFSVAYGLETFTCGLAFIGGPPIAGWLYDVTGSYQYTFYVASCGYFVGALCMIAIYIARRSRST